MGEYSKYDAQLKAEAGIDFDQYMHAMRKAGNETGIYWDVALLLYRVAAHPSTNKVLEFGSGMSTCVLAKAAADFGKEFHSMEHLEQWYNVTRKCMASLKLEAPGYVCTYSDASKFIQLEGEVEVAWVDGPIAHDPENKFTVDRIDCCVWYYEHLKGAVLIFDDAQSMPNIAPWLRSIGRREECDLWFNPVGRKDRQVFMSFPALDHPLYEVVQSCNLGVSK